MALPASGAISLNQVNVELGNAGTASINMNSAAVRGLFGVASGAISMSNGYGKSSQFAFTISSNQTNANLRTLAVNAGWDQSSKVVATINSGIYISSNSTGTPALTVSGSFPGGVELTNGGYIIGMGGAGGSGGSIPYYNWNIYHTPGYPGSAGGGALSVSSAVTITNNGTIGGGGGGGGGGSSMAYLDGKSAFGSSGSGGGGGRSSNAANSAAGPAGSTNWVGTGNAGSAGTVSAAGSGGARVTVNGYYAGAGGGGGGWGASGSTGETSYDPEGNKSGGSGGGSGYAVSGNSNVTWAVTGTRYGTIG